MNDLYCQSLGSVTSGAAGVGADKVLIVGAGVAGLSCGCYLQMNGYRTEILEANSVPGGLCVAWDRGAYTFDGCMRWLVGTNPASAFHQVWHELGAIHDGQIAFPDEFLRIEGREGQVLSMAADIDRLEQNLKRVAPEDAGRVEDLIRAARRCAVIDPPLEKPLELMSGWEKTRLLLGYFPLLPTIIKWKNRSLAAYLESYRNPFLREALLAVAGDGRMSALVLMMVLALRSRKNAAGYPVGGSRAFSEGIARRYASLGGRIRYRVQVETVTVENDRATGVRCADGAAIPASTVISCADGHATVFKMLGGRYINRQIRKTYAQAEVFPGPIQISLGINQTFPQDPQELSLPLARPLLVDDLTQHDRLEVALFGHETELCPAGKTIMIVRFSGHYNYWANLHEHHPEQYTRAKADLLVQLLAILDKRFPGVAHNLEESDVATPATYARYTGNWQASYQGWLPTPRILGTRLPRRLPGLKNFYMGGHWLEPGGGLPPTALSGRYVAQMICARDGRTFKASLP